MAERMPKQFRFRILMLEDEEEWLVPMRSAVGVSLPSERFCVEECNRIVDADKYIRSNRYHFLSIDQNVPTDAGSSVLPEFGLSFHIKCSKSFPVAKHIIYTARGEVRYGNDVGRLGAQYVEKSISGRDSPDKNILSADGWAQFIRDFLTADYVPFALEQFGKWLPLAMAERSRRALDDLQQARHEQYIRRIIDLWDSVLHLSAALTAALCHQADLRNMGTAPRSPKEIELWLDTAWGALAEAGWMGAWPRYIGKGGSDGKGTGRSFLHNASEPIRLLRNTLAHTFPADWWQDKVTKAADSVLWLFDALAFWAEVPLVTQPEFHPRDRGRIIGRSLVGDHFPLNRWEGDIPDLSHLGDRNASLVYIPWRGPDGQDILIPLSPFMVVDTDPATARPSLLLLTCDAPQGRWNYRSLDSGRVEARRLEGQNLTAVTAVFGRR